MSVLATCSRRLLAILAMSCFVTQARAETVYLAPEAFVQEVFGTPPQPELLWLDADVQQGLAKILGHPPRQLRMRYWRRDGKTAWVLDEIGKESPITAGFVVQDQKIERARLLIYRETRGMEVRYPSFLKQFVGATLGADQQLSRPIDGISGATLSVEAMGRMARAALFLTGVAKP